jgi:uncharacterized YccA/Bax inhibitor family protein
MSRSTSNPAFGDRVWERVQQSAQGQASTMGGMKVAQNHATINGTVNKTFLLVLCVVAVSAVSWSYAGMMMQSGLLWLIVIGVAIVQIIMTVMLVKNPAKAPSLSVAYALIEGVVLGAISAIFEMRYPGVVMQATLGTAGVVLGMLIIYRARIIKVTENFKIMVGAATIGIAFVYLVSIIMSFFGTTIPFIHEGSTFGIVFSLFVIGVAAFNLAIDFDFIEKCEEQKAPSYMEWYGAFGLLVTIIWIYIEMLRLIGKTRSK